MPSPAARPAGLLDLRVCSGGEFFARLHRDIGRVGRGDQAALATMSVDPAEPTAARLIDDLCSAAARGARVDVALDAYTLFYPRRIGPFVAPRALAAAAGRDRASAITRLRRGGAACAVVNQDTGGLLRLYAGRSHLKIATAGEHAYIGGPSLHGCDGIDLVAAICDRAVARRLHALVADLVRAGDSRTLLCGTDQTWNLDARSSLLLDAGVPGQSLIYEHALGIIDSARQQLTIACQYFPTGRLARRLLAAQHRGVRVHIAFNHPSRHDQLNAAHGVIIAAARLRRPPQFFAHQVPAGQPKLHAKAIASEHTAMVGSHNLSAAGVYLGTSEIAVIRTEPAFASSVRACLLDQIGPPAPRRPPVRRDRVAA
jgi:phosphatidylserine/phosphatidylglycerophosphate/cardiolipin synthase-like enzyme